MTEHELLLAIQDVLDETVWNDSTSAEIAMLLTENGFAVRDLNGQPWSREEDQKS